MIRRRPRFWFLAAWLSSVVLVLSACGQATQPQQQTQVPAPAAQSQAQTAPAPTRPELTEITVYSNLDAQSPVQLITAMEKGFFKEVGIEKVNTMWYQTASDIPPGMIGGTIKIAHGGFANPLVVNDQGFPVKVVARVSDWARTGQLIVKKELMDKGPKALEGKKLAGPDIPVMRRFWINFTKAYGIDATKVQWVNTAPSDGVTAFIKGDVDAFLCWVPFSIRAVEEGKGVLWHDGIKSYIPGMTGDKTVYLNYGVIFIAKDFIDKYPNTVEAYLKALNKAQAYIPGNKDQVAEWVAKHSKLAPDLVKKLMDLNDYKLSMDTQWLRDAQGEADFYQSAGILKKAVDVKSVVDQQFLRTIDPILVK